MAMSKPSASALTSGARRLKTLAADAISVPTTDELYARKCADLEAAKRKLDAVITRQLKVEENQQHRARDVDPIVAEKRAAETTVARLQHEAGVLKQQIIDARPKPPLTPAQQVWADALATQRDPYAGCARGTPEQIASAQRDVDELVREYRLTTPTGVARDAWTVKKNAAETRLAALQGPPYPPHRPWATNETLKAARLKEGLK
jgi:hypothetical protein